MASEKARRTWALVLSAIAPGTGLVLLRREWLGLAIALLFALVAQLALWGLFIVPDVIPQWLSVCSALIAGAVWLGGWPLVLARIRNVLGPEATSGFSLLCQRARDALEQRQFAQARDLLRLAFSINDEDIEVHYLMARLMTVVGNRREATKAWERVLKLNPDDRRLREAIETVEKLSD